MRRFSLSTKLIAAALPLIVAVAGLLALTVGSDLQDIRRAQDGAELGSVWNPLIRALDAIETEAAGAADALSASQPGGAAAPAPAGDTGDAPVDDTATRRATDEAVNDLRTSIGHLEGFVAASEHITAGRSALAAARRNLDMATIAPDMAIDTEPSAAYALASRELVAVGQLLPAEAGDPQLGSELLALAKLAEAKMHADDVVRRTAQWPNPAGDATPLARAEVSYTAMVGVLSEFEAIAPAAWATEYRESRFPVTVGSYRASLDSVMRAADAGQTQSFDTSEFAAFVAQGVGFQRSLTESIVVRADADADAARTAALTRILITVGAAVLAGAVAMFISRSIARRVRAITDGADRVASEQLPALVQALRDPRGDELLPAIDPVDDRGGDELAGLARAFNSMQQTLVEVADEQVEVLRRGVSDIFVMMARRNRSLIDRQLAMLDQFEARVDDPETLGNYYQLDHLATRMRRNSESLLVLANAEQKRGRVRATEIDDVVRASIGEVEDYRRIEIQQLERLLVRGDVVADVAHLLAELLDNAAAFSPPSSTVRVGGRHVGDDYVLRVVDDGIGIGDDRLAVLNELLRRPPVVGLSVESTLGIPVVSLLAAKHGIRVMLGTGPTGLTADIVLPAAVFAPVAVATPATTGDIAEVGAVPAVQPAPTSVRGQDVVDDTDADRVATLPQVAELSVIEAQPVADLAARTSNVDASQDATGDASVEITRPAPEQLITGLDLTACAVPAPGAADVGDDVPTVARADDPSSQIDDQSSHPDAPSTQIDAPRSHPDAPSSQIEAPSSQIDAPPKRPDAPFGAPLGTALAGLAAGSADGAPLPPPVPATPHGEFDTPPAPPLGVGGPAQRPVTPAGALPLPAPVPSPAAPPLPTRVTRDAASRDAARSGPDRPAHVDPGPVDPAHVDPGHVDPGHVDRGPVDPGHVDRGPVDPGQVDRGRGADRTRSPEHAAPGALHAGLTGFDVEQPVTDEASTPLLPVRSRNDIAPSPIDEPGPVARSLVDPNAMRDRLRAFQSQFASGGEHASNPAPYDDHHGGPMS